MSECPVCQSPVEEGSDSCSVCGFRLKGKTKAFEPIPVGENADAPKASSDAALRVVRGPQVGVTYSLQDGDTTIGRNPSCDIFLNDMTVSRSHATIRCISGSHVISDEQSYNGVWVNNTSIEAKVLEPGDFVQIGKFGFVYESA